VTFLPLHLQVTLTTYILNSPQSNDKETPRAVASPFHNTGAGSAQAYPVFKQQSATSTRVAPNAPKFFKLSHAQPSGSAPHSNHTTQSSSGSPPYGAQPPRAPHREQPSSQSRHDGNIRSGSTRNITSTNLQVMGTDNIDDTHNPNDNATNSDDHGDASDASNTNVGVRRRSSLNKTAPDATQLRFYSGCWVDVLKDAKYQYRFYIHTDDPFPERSRESLSDAHDCLVEAIAKFRDEIKLPLDEGLLQCFIR
jgi:hypothetical protein